jgi:hypothetical protein
MGRPWLASLRAGDRNVAVRFPARPQRARPIITDNRRVYTDAEFALILRKATELATPEETPGQASSGLTLAQIKAAAAEAGIDPALVERAAQLLPASVSSSRYERLIGGAMRPGSEIHLPVRLDEADAAKLLAAVQISAGQAGTGHSSALGMAWHASDELEPLSVTARTDESGTSIAVRLDRRGTLAIIHAVSVIGTLCAASAGVAIASQVDSALGPAAALIGLGGMLTVARTWWASSTRRARERIDGVMEAMGQVVAQSGKRPSASSATQPAKRLTAEEP